VELPTDDQREPFPNVGVNKKFQGVKKTTGTPSLGRPRKRREEAWSFPQKERKGDRIIGKKASEDLTNLVNKVRRKEGNREGSNAWQLD